MAETLTTSIGQENESLLAILHAGKELYQEIHRNIFVSESEIAERLRNRGEQFINSLIIASRHLQSNRDIADNVINTVVEFQQLISRLEERFQAIEEDELHYVCPNEGVRDQGRGKPMLLIPKEQLEGLRSLGFSWISISKMLGVSEKTLRRRREAYGISSTHEQFMEITDEQVDDLVKSALEVSPNSGERMVMGFIRGRGKYVQRWRVRKSIWRVDPVNRELRRRTITQRRVYHVPTPNSLWHLDGHHKLIRWRFVIHGAIDGYSRVVVFLKASTNNRASTVLDLFIAATQVFHYPRRIRTDFGTENVDVARNMLNRYGPASNPVLTGQSVHNQRIERLWRDVHNYVVTIYKNVFHYLESVELLDPNNEIDLYALHYVFLPRLNKSLDTFVMQWNNHPLSSEHGHTPFQVWTQGFYHFALSDYTTVREILDPNSVDFQQYGIDDDGPLPEVQTENFVEIPRSAIELTCDEYQLLTDNLDPSVDDNDHGITAYQSAKNMLRTILNDRA